MNKKMQHALVAIALIAIAATTVASAEAQGKVTPDNPGKPAWLSGYDLRQVSVRPDGPEADPYFEHRVAPVKPAVKLWLAGVDLRHVAVNGPGPEADPYLQHAPAR